MGLLTVELPDDLIAKLKECGAYVPEIVERAIRNAFYPILIQYGISSASSFNWEFPCPGE